MLLENGADPNTLRQLLGVEDDSDVDSGGGGAVQAIGNEKRGRVSSLGASDRKYVSGRERENARLSVNCSRGFLCSPPPTRVASPSLEGVFSGSPLYIATRNNHCGAAVLLAEHGAELSLAADGDGGGGTVSDQGVGKQMGVVFHARA